MQRSLTCLLHCTGGVLLVIPNYTGDCLNFGLASEWAQRDGISVCFSLGLISVFRSSVSLKHVNNDFLLFKLQIESVIVGEDCALLNSGKSSSAGRRGMCGLVFVYKVSLISS